MNSKHWLAGIIAVILIGGLALVLQQGSNNRPAETVKVGFMPITADYQYFVAKEKGFFEEEGLAVDEVKFASSNQMLEALIQGKIDVIASAAAPTAYIIDEKSQGFIKIFAYTDDNNLPALIVSLNSSISSVKDLQG